VIIRWRQPTRNSCRTSQWIWRWHWKIDITSLWFGWGGWSNDVKRLTLSAQHCLHLYATTPEVCVLLNVICTQCCAFCFSFWRRIHSCVLCYNGWLDGATVAHLPVSLVRRRELRLDKASACVLATNTPCRNKITMTIQSGDCEVSYTVTEKSCSYIFFVSNFAINADQLF